ncbi:hypothetical protein BDA96_10G086500 [Sorghum bicolor]|uniref:Uncharacterized protein n=1 Tax=Sorghum bicolor TaxID=4558 RepID=A0A921Q3T9_SORBI|nr:hypothetical protein BDA96_10G086500 [Sorghum bicolor]
MTWDIGSASPDPSRDSTYVSRGSTDKFQLARPALSCPTPWAPSHSADGAQFLPRPILRGLAPPKPDPRVSFHYGLRSRRRVTNPTNSKPNQCESIPIGKGSLDFECYLP